MPDVHYSAERRTSAFRTARLSADVVCAGDILRIIKHLNGMVRAIRDAGRQATLHGSAEVFEEPTR
jgi:hypothetical protein